VPGAHSSCPSCARMGVPDGGQDVSQRILSNTFGTAPRSGHALAPPAGWRDIAPRCRAIMESTKSLLYSAFRYFVGQG